MENEAELLDAIGTLEHAIGILENNREGYALVQINMDPTRLNTMLATLNAVTLSHH